MQGKPVKYNRVPGNFTLYTKNKTLDVNPELSDFYDNIANFICPYKLARYMGLDKFIQKKSIFLLLALILGVSFFIRLYGMETENIWPDEGLTIYNAHKSISHNVGWSLSLAYFPLYHIILSAWEKFFGLSEFSMRLLSVIFGTLSVYIVYLIGSLMFGKKAGIYSALITALSSYHVYYSQEARVYMLFALLALLSIYFYLKYLQSTRNKDLAYYILFTLLMLNTHGPAIFILFFQNVHYLLFTRKGHKKWIFTQCAIFISFLPLLIIVLSRMSELSHYLTVSKPGIIAIARTFYTFSAGTTYEPMALAFGAAISLLFFILAFLAITPLYKNIKNRDYAKLSNISFLLLWLIAPMLLLVLQSYAFYSLYFDRYIIASSIALYLLVAASISALKKKSQLIAMFSIIMLSSALLAIDFETSNKGRWKDMADYIHTNKNREDAVILHIPNVIYPFAYYSDPGCFKSADLEKCMSEQNVYAVKNADELPADIAKKDKVFLVLFNEKYMDVQGTLSAYFLSNYSLSEEKDYPYIKILIFTKGKT